MSVIISYIQIALSVIMVALILIQHSDESLGSAFGASGSEGQYRTRRGAELYIFRATIAVAILFVLSALANILY
ncbi:MAG TPA: preprotein translocase subunit SecG [Candidatus Paceibacterota bacterium]